MLNQYLSPNVQLYVLTVWSWGFQQQLKCTTITLLSDCDLFGRFVWASSGNLPYSGNNKQHDPHNNNKDKGKSRD